MNRFRSILILIVASVCLTGCASFGGAGDRSTEARIEGIARERLEITRQMRGELLEMAKSVEHSTRVLAEVRNAESAIDLNRQEMVQQEWNSSEIPDGMGISMTMSQTGHPGPMIEMIASVTGYTYQSIGTPGAGILAVRIDETTTAHQILRSVGTQMGPSVLVQVVPSSRTITVNWAYGRDRLAGGVE